MQVFRVHILASVKQCYIVIQLLDNFWSGKWTLSKYFRFLYTWKFDFRTRNYSEIVRFKTCFKNTSFLIALCVYCNNTFYANYECKEKFFFFDRPYSRPNSVNGIKRKFIFENDLWFKKRRRIILWKKQWVETIRFQMFDNKYTRLHNISVTCYRG